MRTSIIFVLMLCLVSSCATQSRAMRGPNGNMAYSISCKRGIENCYEQASQNCKKGYTLISQGQKTKGYVSTGYAVVPVSQDNIFIECK